MTKNLTLIIVLLFFPVFALFSQKVIKIEPSLSDNKIIVNYTISGAKFNQSFIVNLYVSKDRGKNFIGPLNMVSGDVGEGIKKGSHSIIWDFLKEIPFSEEDLIFDVRAEVMEKAIDKEVFISYVGNITTPIGLRLGMIGKLGWFIEGRISLQARETVVYEYDGETINNWDKLEYYSFNGNSGYSAMSVCGGFTFQPSWNFFLYLGGGYGKDWYVYEIDEYTYQDDSKTGSSWVKDNEYCYSGFEVDAGAMVRVGKVLLSGGINSINFKTVNWTAGIGLSF